MKATFQVPDDLCREVIAETARDGHTVREVAISLFKQWLRQKKDRPTCPAHRLGELPITTIPPDAGPSDRSPHGKHDKINHIKME